MEKMLFSCSNFDRTVVYLSYLSVLVCVCLPVCHRAASAICEKEEWPGEVRMIIWHRKVLTCDGG